jgi:hypothetical protein
MGVFMIEISKEDLIVRKILEMDYDSESLFLGNVNAPLMASVEQRLITGIGQDIAVVNMLNSNMIAADNTGIEDIIFEYFFGFVYDYISSNPTFREKYFYGSTEEKVAFFNSLLECPFDIKAINENKNNLFSFYPDRAKLIRESDFKICLLNYQCVRSSYLIRQINSLMRARPHTIILSQGCGLKDNNTLFDGEWVNVWNDFKYFDIGRETNSTYRLEKK